MTVEIKISTNAQEIRKKLKRVRVVGVNKAWKATMDYAAKLIAKEIIKHWDRLYKKHRRNFPNRVLRVSKAYINFDTGELKRAANVHNIEKVDHIFRQQMEGGTRRPRKADNLLVPLEGTRIRRGKKGNRYVKGKALYAYSKRGPDKAIAVITPKAVIPRRFSVAIPLARVQSKISMFAERRLREELRRALAKGYK